MKKLNTLIALLLAVSVFSQTEFAELQWKYVPDLDDIGLSNMFTYDVNSDGIPEVLYGATQNGHSVIKAIGAKDGKYEPLVISRIYDWKILWMDKYHIPEFGGDKIFVLSDKNELSIMDFQSLTIDTTLTMPSGAKKFILDDTNGDDKPEIIVLTGNAVLILDLNGNSLAEKSLSAAYDIAVGNVDDDPTKEIMVASNDGYVLNGNDLSEKWVYVGGFGKRLVVQDIDNDGQHLIYAAEYQDYLRCFDGQLKSPLWEMNVDGPITYIEVEDPNADGEFEIIIGKGDWTDAIQTYDADSRTLLWTMPIENDGIAGMTFGDFDDDAGIEYVYGCGYSVSSEDLLVAFDPQALTNEWVSLDLSEGMLCNLGYYDQQDEHKDLIIGSVSSNNGYDGGTAIVVDGLSKEQLRAPQLVHDYLETEVYDMVRYEDNTYLMYLFSGEIQIFNETSGQFVIDERLSAGNVNSGDIIFLKEGEPPVLVLLHTSGALKIYEFHNGALNEIWSSVSGARGAIAYQIGNFDSDLDREIAYLAGSAISVYNLETFLLEKQIDLGSTAHNAFYIADRDNNGEREVYYTSGDSRLNIIDYESNTSLGSLLLPDNLTDHPIKKVLVKNIDDSDEPEVIALTDRLLIYNNEIDELLFRSEIIHLNTYFWTQGESVLVEDIDGDQHTEVIVSGLFGVFEYKVNSRYKDVSLPQIVNHFPSDSAVRLSTDASIRLGFSEIMDSSTLQTIEIKDGMDNLLPFTSQYDSETNDLSMSPVNFWPVESEIKITVFNTASDTSGNPLDGNNNGIDDGAEDDYSWSFFTGSGVDTMGPRFPYLQAPGEIYQGVPLDISGMASDSSLYAESGISYIEYSLDALPVAGQGTSIAAMDKVYDEVEEGFSITLTTTSLQFGLHTVYFRSRDILGNWGPVDSLVFRIKTESPSDWTHYGANLMNTSANEHSQFQTPMRIHYRKSYNVDQNEVPISRAIIVEDNLIFGASSFFDLKKLICMDIHSGETRWEKTYDVRSELSTPVYAYGNVYVQVGNHSNSKLACFDLSTGALIWETPYEVQWQDLTGPVAAGGHIYIAEGYYEPELGAYDAFTGELLWKYKMDIGSIYDNWNPAFYKDTVFAYTKHFIALDPELGNAHYVLDEEDIAFDGSGHFTITSPVIDTVNHQIILTSEDYLHALDLQTRQINWSISSEDHGRIRAMPALFDGNLYVATDDRLLRLDAGSGEVNWENNEFTGIFQPVANKNIVAFSNQKEVFIFDRNTMNVNNVLYDFGGHLTLSEDYLILSSKDSSSIIAFEYNPDHVPMNAEITVEQPVSCNGEQDGSIVVNASGGSEPYSYHWKGSQMTTQRLSDLGAGVYSVTVSDEFGNIAIDSIVISEPPELLADIYTTPDVNGDGNGSVQVEPSGGNPPYSYEWTDFPGLDTNQIYNLEAGNYTVRITDTKECTLSTTAVVDATTGLIDVVGNYNFRIFPNPTTERLILQSKAGQVVGTVVVSTIKGEQIMIYEDRILNNFRFSLKGQPAGVYLISVITERGKESFKVSLIQ